MTSNPAIARAYAHTISAWLRDLMGARPAPGGPLPVAVLELGPGSGRLTNLLLSALQRALPGANGRRHPLRYICANVSLALLESIRSHPANDEWVRSGMLRFARTDAESPDALHPIGTEADGLVHAGGALVVIANYVFDSLPPGRVLRLTRAAVADPRPREPGRDGRRRCRAAGAVARGVRAASGAPALLR